MWLILPRKWRAVWSTHARCMSGPFIFSSSANVAFFLSRVTWIWRVQTECLYSGSNTRSSRVFSCQLRTIFISSGCPSAENLERDSNHFLAIGSLLWSRRPRRQITNGMMIESQRTLSRRSGAMPMLSSRYMSLLPQSLGWMSTDRCLPPLKGVAASREVMVGILAGIKCRYCSGWKFGSVWRVLTRSHADSDMLLQLLGFAHPPNVI
jgi:hypothetical protein